jgi:RimJ/RimL family protein N-acetyltransferase
MTTIPEFEVGRLRYRAPRMDDFETYAEFRASERSKGVGGPNTRAQSFDALCGIIGQWQLRGYGRWMIADRETDAPLGVVGVYHPENWPEREIGWTVFEAAEGKGYAFEAAQIARRYAYDTLGFTTIISCIMPGNTRSAALAVRMGATLERTDDLPGLGPMEIWRHPGPEALA